ncbi:hypothetical protein BU23DRAFT_586541 [Bimuria novae-zelandiae CBS 107.79]|uniref:UMTA methyltransferase family protein n=1 Tax=Bimuria novae-zelandiae CBS 107.79 TaxID=1447943 RepID=A0A6A5VRQ5_9PLEO|nr:hypothetical protein BU23DRAFT_586541 [Bimuria novae-zelandiae CBS 107.79]
MSSSQSPKASDADNEYLLSRGYVAASRLNLQHYLWQGSLNYIGAPSILVPPGARITDRPDCRLIGFDLDLSQAPNPGWLPPQINLKKWNIFELVHPDYWGKFDIVHVRLLVMVLTGKDKTQFIDALLMLLKPGGWLQWDELNTIDMHVRKLDKSVATPGLDRICKGTAASGRYDWTLRIPELLISRGFEKVKMAKFGDSPHLARAFNDQNLMTMDEVAAGMEGSGKADEASKLKSDIGKAYAESIAGAALCIPRIVVLAQRPMQLRQES